ncbi:MAG: dolichyl-phosphate beta-glucosyltransferase [Candidatus Omnitrophota bacterium]
MSPIHLSVVVPAFNEEKRVPLTLPGVVDYLRRQSFSSEIILVDDGSMDATVREAERVLDDFEHKILRNEQNRGKGYSVRRGILASRGRYVLFSDADFSTPIEEVEGFLTELEKNYGIVIGSRALANSQIEEHQPFWREIMGRVFNRFAQIFAFRDILDSQCGFKAFRGDLARRLFAQQKLDGFSFDAEILYLAQKEGILILEKPVVWRNSPQSRVKLLSDPVKMFFDLVKIRWLHRQG